MEEFEFKLVFSIVGVCVFCGISGHLFYHFLEYQVFIVLTLIFISLLWIFAVLYIFPRWFMGDGDNDHGGGVMNKYGGWR